MLKINLSYFIASYISLVSLLMAFSLIIKILMPTSESCYSINFNFPFNLI